MDTEKIFIGIDDKKIELTGKKLTDFLTDREAMQAEHQALRLEQDAKVAARESALAKLAALGLTADEVAAL
jgi:hypothetical protein